MLNMIKLDWLGMKFYQKRFVVIPLCVCSMGFIHELLIIPIIALFMLSFSVNPFAVEEKGKLDNLYLTLPVTRKTVVNARLSLSLIMLCIGLVFGTVMTVIISKLLYGKVLLFTHDFHADFNSVFLLICSSLLFYAVMNLSTFPILFKVGYAKGKVFGFYIPIIGAFILGYAAFFMTLYSDTFRDRAIALLEWSIMHTLGASAVMLAVAVLLLVISFLLSHKVYEKREF